MCVILVFCGIALGWKTGNDNSGRKVSVSSVEGQVFVDSASDPSITINVENGTGELVNVERVDAEAGCRTTLEMQGLPARLGPHQALNLTAKLNLDVGYLHPIFYRKVELPIELLPVVRDKNGKLWVSNQWKHTLRTYRSIVASRSKIYFPLKDEQRFEVAPTTLTLELFDEVGEITARVEKSEGDATWMPTDQFKLEISQPNSSHRILKITMQQSPTDQQTRFRITVTGLTDRGQTSTCSIPIEFLEFSA